MLKDLKSPGWAERGQRVGIPEFQGVKGRGVAWGCTAVPPSQALISLAIRNFASVPLPSQSVPTVPEWVGLSLNGWLIRKIEKIMPLSDWQCPPHVLVAEETCRRKSGKALSVP